MRRLGMVGVAVALCLIEGAANQAIANIVVSIDKSTQRMSVSIDGVPLHSWEISTGRAGYGTPNGVYHPQRLARSWFSRKYYNSPMPHSIFFQGGFAIHGSYEISQLGGPASHGCVRLHPTHAATLFALVQKEGADNTRIVVSGSNPIETHRVRYEPSGDQPFYQSPVYLQPLYGFHSNAPFSLQNGFYERW